MPRIQHIAISAKDNAALAEFYKNVFGMEEVFVQRTSDPNVNAYFLTDGHINLALLPCGPNTKEGINHFGFLIDDMDDTTASAVESGASKGPQRVPQDGRFAEQYILDPVGTRVDLSVSGWATGPMNEDERHEKESQFPSQAPTPSAR